MILDQCFFEMKTNNVGHEYVVNCQTCEDVCILLSSVVRICSCLTNMSYCSCFVGCEYVAFLQPFQDNHLACELLTILGTGSEKKTKKHMNI